MKRERATKNKIKNSIVSSASNSCDLDPIPKRVLKIVLTY